MPDIKTIADNANIVVNGYAFTREEERLSLLPMIGERFGEWFEAFLARKVGWSVKSDISAANVQRIFEIRKLIRILAQYCHKNGGALI